MRWHDRNGTQLVSFVCSDTAEHIRHTGLFFVVCMFCKSNSSDCWSTLSDQIMVQIAAKYTEKKGRTRASGGFQSVLEKNQTKLKSLSSGLGMPRAP
mgnify:CR=1 FL=1